MKQTEDFPFPFSAPPPRLAPVGGRHCAREKDQTGYSQMEHIVGNARSVSISPQFDPTATLLLVCLNDWTSL